MSEMELVERYLSIMAERLPEKIRDDVINEMRGNIMDMLPDAPAEEDIRTVLEKLGDPAVLASSYIKDKKYLIGPDVYDSYFSVLKLSVGLVAIVFAFLSLMGFLFRQPETAIGISVKTAVDFSVELITGILSSAFQGALLACVWVTIVFIILERTGTIQNNPFRKKQWTVEDLPLQSSDNKGRISRVETIAGLFCSIFFTALLLTRPQLIGWYEKVNDILVLKEPLFNKEQLYSYIFTIVVLAAVQFVLSIYKFVVKRWNLPMAILNTANNIALAVFIYFISKDLKLINAAFISLFAQKIGWSDAKLLTVYQSAVTGFVVLFILACAIDSISGFVKSRRLKLPSLNINIK